MSETLTRPTIPSQASSGGPDMGVSGKLALDWAAFRQALTPVETIDTPSTVKKRSRDFFWYSPILSKELAGDFGDLIVAPKSEDELARCIAAAVRSGVPMVARGGGTGNYGQAVPRDGGIIVDMTGIRTVLEILENSVTVQAGAKIADINAALAEKGRELPIYPSTQAIATIGGFIAGGSGGVGSIREGMLRDRGNLLELVALSIEEEPARHRFVGADTMNLHHAWGINGIITEVKLRTVPLVERLHVFASFDTYANAFAAGAAAGRDETLDLKLLTCVDAGIVSYFRPLEGHVRAGRPLLVASIAIGDAPALETIVRKAGGNIDVALDDAGMNAAKLPLPVEFSYNHTTLHVLKADRSVTYLQARVPVALDPATVMALQAELGDEVLMHHEFAMLNGALVAFDLPVVRYTTPERLYEIMAIYERHGFTVSDPHRASVEGGGMKADYRHLAWKKRLDPHGLLNSAKSEAWENVKHLSPEAIERL